MRHTSNNKCLGKLFIFFSIMVFSFSFMTVPMALALENTRDFTVNNTNGMNFNGSGFVMNSGNITVNVTQSQTYYGMRIMSSSAIVINTGTINVNDTGSGSAYGIYLNTDNGIVLNQLGSINVQSIGNKAEVLVESTGRVDVNAYATRLRDYATYGYVFERKSGTLNFNNTRFIVRPGIGQGFKGLGVAHAVSEMINGGVVANTTGKVGSVETEISTLKATLTGTTLANQAITLNTNVNKKTDQSLQNSLNQLNNLLNTNDRLAIQQFLTNNKNLFDSLYGLLSAEELLALKIYIQNLVDNTPQLQEIIASFEDEPKEEEIKKEEPIQTNQIPFQLHGMFAEVMDVILSIRTNAANDLFASSLGAVFSVSNSNPLLTILATGGPSGFIKFIYSKDNSNQLLLDFNYVPENAKAHPEFKVFQNALNACVDYVNNFEIKPGIDSIRQVNAEWGKFFQETLPAIFKGSLFESKFTFDMATKKGKSAGSPMQSDVVVSDFVNDFVEDLAVMLQAQAKTPDWSVSISPYGNASYSNDNTSNTGAVGFSGGITRNFNEKFSLGMHFDFGYSSSDSDNLSTDSNTITGTLGLNTNYKITPEWYVGATISGALSSTHNSYSTGTSVRYLADNSHGGASLTAALNTGYTFKINDNHAFVPEFGLSYVYQHTGANSINWDNGGSYMDMDNEATNYSAFYGNVALRWLGSFKMEEGYMLKPFVSLGLRQNLSANPLESSMSFFNSNFDNEATPDLTTVTSNVGIEFAWDDFSVNLNYNGAYGSEKTNHGGAVNLTWTF